MEPNEIEMYVTQITNSGKTEEEMKAELLAYYLQTQNKKIINPQILEIMSLHESKDLCNTTINILNDSKAAYYPYIVALKETAGDIALVPEEKKQEKAQIFYDNQATIVMAYNNEIIPDPLSKDEEMMVVSEHNNNTTKTPETTKLVMDEISKTREKRSKRLNDQLPDRQKTMKAA